MVIYHRWDNTIRFVESVNAENMSITTTGMGRKPWNSWGKGDRYHLENFRAALDAPGEWFLAREGCQNCTLQRSYIHDFGAGGVRIGETGVPKNEREQTGRITLDKWTRALKNGTYVTEQDDALEYLWQGGNLVPDESRVRPKGRPGKRR